MARQEMYIQTGTGVNDRRRLTDVRIQTGTGVNERALINAIWVQTGTGVNDRRLVWQRGQTVNDWIAQVTAPAGIAQNNIVVSLPTPPNLWRLSFIEIDTNIFLIQTSFGVQPPGQPPAATVQWRMDVNGQVWTGNNTVRGGEPITFNGTHAGGLPITVTLAIRHSGSTNSWAVFTATGTVGSGPAPAFTQIFSI